MIGPGAAGQGTRVEGRHRGTTPTDSISVFAYSRLDVNRDHSAISASSSAIVSSLTGLARPSCSSPNSSFNVLAALTRAAAAAPSSCITRLKASLTSTLRGCPSGFSGTLEDAPEVSPLVDRLRTLGLDVPEPDLLSAPAMEVTYVDASHGELSASLTGPSRCCDTHTYAWQSLPPLVLLHRRLPCGIAPLRFRTGCHRPSPVCAAGILRFAALFCLSTRCGAILS
jgi:hypothetical protein